MDEFYQSFAINENEDYVDFFNKNGFVVVRDVLDDESCDQTLDNFWSHGSIDRTDPSTWDEFWNDQEFSKFSIIGSDASMSHSLLSNRQNRNIYNVFRHIYKTDKLYVDHDRIGVMRPTVNVKFQDKCIDMPEWKTVDRWLHIDCNPFNGRTDISGFRLFSDSFIDFTQNLFCQGLIALTDAKIDDGGFHCVPRSHIDPNIYKSMDHSYGNIQVPIDHPMRLNILKIPVKKGSLIVWNTLTAHANYPNNSSNFRAVQYIRMIPSTNGSYQPLFPHLSDKYPEGFHPAKLGRKLFGIDTWDKQPL